MGRLGSALALAMSDAGFTLSQIVYRSGSASGVLDGQIPEAQRIRFADLTSIEAEILFITTADLEIESTAHAIDRLVGPGTVVLHASGALSSEILGVLKQKGCATGSMHPLLSVSEPVRAAQNFADAYFCIEGDDAAVSAAVEIVNALGGRPFSIGSDLKALYHAAAVMASGHLTALADLAATVLAHCGVRAADPMEVLLPLIKSTVGNLAVQSPSDAMTGPIARGDLNTVRRHVQAFDDAGLERAREVYLSLAAWAAELVGTSGAGNAGKNEIAEFIKLAQGSGR